MLSEYKAVVMSRIYSLARKINLLAVSDCFPHIYQFYIEISRVLPIFAPDFNNRSWHETTITDSISHIW